MVIEIHRDWEGAEEAADKLKHFVKNVHIDI